MTHEDKSSVFVEDIPETKPECSTQNEAIKNESNSTLSQLLLPEPSSHYDIEISGAEPLGRSATLSSTFSQFRQRFSGWKAGLILAISADGFVLAVVLSLTLSAALGSRRDGKNAILVDEDCAQTKQWSIWLHLLINVLSTVLLSTSSYAMQCLGSPTRSEVNAAHTKGKYLNIGVPSLSNLLSVKKSRMIFYILLVVTSLPLHLLANSIIYETQGANSYLLAVVDHKFISLPISDIYTQYAARVNGFNAAETIHRGNRTEGNPDNTIHLGWNFTETLKDLVPSMERLENWQCIEAYSNPLSPTRSNIIAVATGEQITAENSNFILSTYYQSVDFCPTCQTYLNWTDPTLWTCAFTSPSTSPVISCNTNKAMADADDFSINDIPIDYCLSQKATEKCQLQASIPLMIVVVICACTKTAILVAVLKSLPNEILATIGDAIASFLGKPDPQTADACLLDREDIQKKQWVPGQYFAKRWTSSSSNAIWARGPRASVWTRTTLMMLAILIVSIALLGTGVTKLRNTRTGQNVYDNSGAPPIDGASLFRVGFGTTNVNLLLQLPDMTKPNNVIGHVLLVNAPQLILSIAYFSYNACWTNMLVAREWAQFGRLRQTLRVSMPAGEQRMQYFLTVPWRFAIFLQIASALLHWLLSQSFFLARINAYPAEPFVGTPPSVINTVGYSLISLLFLIILWTLLFIVILGFGWGRKLRSPMPIVAGCSFAISAACHTSKTEIHAALRPLMWGVVDSMEKPDGVKHCCFTSGVAYSPANLEKAKVTRLSGYYEESAASFA